jgi:hypothetical protein
MNLKRTLACLFILAALPLLASPSHSNSINPVPFATIAFAGHVSGGSYACDCGCPSCICDTGETPGDCGGQGLNSVSNQPDNSFGQDASPVGAGRVRNFDFGSSALMLALAAFVWARFLRA